MWGGFKSLMQQSRELKSLLGRGFALKAFSTEVGVLHDFTVKGEPFSQKEASLNEEPFW